MIAALSNLAFLNPWILGAFIFLPGLWFLLKVLPPAPRRVLLPTAQFLLGLRSHSQTHNTTPLWLLLLRLALMALIILAISRPVVNPPSGLSGPGDLLIVFDNSWSAAPSWKEQMNAAQSIIEQAGRDDRRVMVFPLALEVGAQYPQALDRLQSSQALARLKALRPLPWPVDLPSAHEVLSGYSLKGNASPYWFSSGLDVPGFRAFAKTLSQIGATTFYAPAPEHLPSTLSTPPPSDRDERRVDVVITAPRSVPKHTPLIVHAYAASGNALGQEQVLHDPSQPSAHIDFDLPPALAAQVSHYRIAGQAHAGAVFVLPNSAHKRRVGIVSADETGSRTPFIDASYYLTRALEPFSDLSQGALASLLDEAPDVLILPDGFVPAPDLLSRLSEWVDEGGILLRFAGPSMVSSGNGGDFLVPVPLRLSGRSLQGALTWDTPARLSAFSDTSPLAGVALQSDVLVRSQILAQPGGHLETASWASLEDGTPLITGAAQGRGLLVFVHTTATPEWSDFALSGTYVQVLKRLVSLSGATVKTNAALAQNTLPPRSVLDGYGQMSAPKPSVKPLVAQDIERGKVSISAAHPPGIYGQGADEYSLNLGDHVIDPHPAPTLGATMKTVRYGAAYMRDFLPFLLTLALLVFIAELLLTSLFYGQRSVQFKRNVAVIVFMITFSFALPQASLANDIDAANGFHLAYIKTNSDTLNALSRSALENLALALNRRTSMRIEGVKALNPHTDSLVFYPLIYWPLTPSTEALSGPARKNVQHYLDHGGVILMDTRDGSTNRSFSIGPLQKALQGLSLPALHPVPKDHVLSKSFYLLEQFPGHLNTGEFWVQQEENTARDGVSPIMIGSNDWASAWASGRDRSRRRELSIRFGVNLVMYALTGNYKADQVHLPHILERMGR